MGTLARISSSLIFAATLFCAPLLVSGQTDTTWTGGTGNWSNSAQWTNGTPNGNYNAAIDAGNSANSSVSLDINASVANLSISTGDSLSIGGNHTLFFQSSTPSTLANDGILSIASGSGISALGGSSLTIQDVNVFGGSTINMLGGSISGGTGGVSIFDSIVTGTGIITGLEQAHNTSLIANGGTLTLVPGSAGFSLLGGGELSVAAGSELRITGGQFNQYNSVAKQLGGLLTSINLSGKLEFDNADISSLSMSSGTKLTLSGPQAAIVDQFGNNALAHLSSLGADLLLTNGAVLSTSGSFFNNARTFPNSLQVTNASFFSVGGDYTNGTEGFLVVSGGSLMNVNGTLFATRGGPAAVNVLSGSIVNVLQDLRVSGITSLNVSGGSIVNVGGSLINGQSLGSIKVDTTSIANVGSLYQQDFGELDLQGIMSSEGVAINGGTYNQSSSATLAIRLGSDFISLDPTNAFGTANLDGTLAMLWLPGFNPDFDQIFTIMTFGTLNGRFASISGLDLGNGRYLNLAYNEHDIDLRVPEPSALFLLLAGTLLVFASGRIKANGTRRGILRVVRF
jgi:hypothetical protein